MRSINDDDWLQILKLTNLKSYSEGSYLGSNKDRLTDLIVMKHLTFLELRENSNSHGENITLSTSLQLLSGFGYRLGGAKIMCGSSELEVLVCSKMPYCKVDTPLMSRGRLTGNRTIRFVNANK